MPKIFSGLVKVACFLCAAHFGNAQSVVKPAGTGLPMNVQTNAAPSMQTIESSNLDADFSPGERTTNAPAELDEIYADARRLFQFHRHRSALRSSLQPSDTLYEATGLRLGAANTMLYMEPIGGQSSQYGAAFDIDVLSSWTLIGRGTEDTGRLVVTGEYRKEIRGPARRRSLGGRWARSSLPPTHLTIEDGSSGTSIGSRDSSMRAFAFSSVAADPSDYVGAIWMGNVNNSFVNRSFSANPAVAFPGSRSDARRFDPPDRPFLSYWGREQRLQSKLPPLRLTPSSVNGTSSNSVRLAIRRPSTGSGKADILSGYGTWMRGKSWGCLKTKE